jgi:proteasome beta subunit
MYTMDTKSRPTIRAAAKLLSLILFQNRFFPYYVELLVGGIDEEGPHIFAMDPVGSLIEDDYTAAGTGARLAIAVVESNYRRDITVEAARELAIRAVNQAISRDPVSGDGIDLLIITRNTAREETIPLAPQIRP